MKNKVRLVVVMVDGLETKIALKDEELASRFCFWLIGNDYEFSYKLMPEGYTVQDNGRGAWLLGEFLKEDNFTR